MSWPAIRSRLGTCLTMLLAALWVLPIAFMLQQSASLEALNTIFAQPLALRWVANSALTSVIITLLVIGLCAPCAYAFSQLDFPAKEMIYWILLAALFVPREVLFVPQFILMDDLKFIDTYQGIILPQLITPIAILVFRRYFDRVDRALYDAATLEGASALQIFSRIYLPLNQGVAWALAAYIFIGAWNNFFWPFLVIYSDEMKTIAVGLAGAYSFVILAVTLGVAVLAMVVTQYLFARRLKPFE